MAGATATRRSGRGKSNAHLFGFDRQCGVDLVAGVDEAGRAALAGPLVAAAVLFDYRAIGRPEQRLLAELNDSKKISAAVRDRLLPKLFDLAAATATVIVPADEIDRVGLHRSNLNALVRALAGLQLPGGAALPDDAALLVDGFAIDGDRYRKVIRGDSQSAAIAAASIIAKITRDRMMHEYAAVYPAYGFERHAGYLTSAHSAAVLEHGPSPIHRLSFQARCYQQRLSTIQAEAVGVRAGDAVSIFASAPSRVAAPRRRRIACRRIGRDQPWHGLGRPSGEGPIENSQRRCDENGSKP